MKKDISMMVINIEKELEIPLKDATMTVMPVVVDG